MVPYTYSILRYVHDPSVGESVNVGLLFYAPEARYVRLWRDGHYGHLSKTFAGFDPDEYRRVLGWLEAAVERFQNSLQQAQLGLFRAGELPADAGVLGRQLVPDQGLSLQWGPTGAGITRQIEATGAAVFERLVTSQRPADGKRERRDDDALWDSCRDVLRRYEVTRALRPHTIITNDLDIPFEHAFQNEKWHAVKPMSFDYLDAATIRERAAQWVGYGVALSASDDFAKLYLLLGKPTLAAHLRDYVRAKNYLSKMLIRPEIIEEDGVEDFARDLAAYMRQHGILPDQTGVASANGSQEEHDSVPPHTESPRHQLKA